MNRFLSKYDFYLSAAVYLLLFFATLGWYKFNFDVDGIGYMTVAYRMAHGDWFKAINGLWSPLNSFIASFFIEYIKNPLIAFKIINAVCSIGIIYVTGLLAKRILQNNFLIRGILIVLPFFLLANTHTQLAGDLLSLLFLLIYCQLITSKNFFSKKDLNVYCGIIMALAYFSKSYCLPFFIINHIVIHLWNQYYEGKKLLNKFVAMRVIIAFTIFFIITTPWIYCLYLKYNHIIFSTAGMLNYNWFLENGPATIKNYGLLIPPPYANSPNFWEDPYPYYNSFLGPLSSFTNFLRAIKLILHNVKESFGLFTEISFTVLPVFMYWFVRMIKIKANEIPFSISLLLISSALLVAGYLLIHIETRYIWLTGIIGLILGAKILEEKILPFLPNKNFVTFIVLLFTVSFLVAPADKLQDLRYSGKDIYEGADFLSSNNINGNFTSNYSTNAQNSWCVKLAFLSHTRFYLLAKNDYTQSELIDAIHQNNISFYFYFYNTTVEKEVFVNSPLAIASKRIISLPEKNILMVQFQ
ncbi:MAG TPA: hypothetical protein VFN30_09915 [Chitinophagaceae bacterium]|nr:hypothetical protein [Chitinophagaceae bacterium]